MFIIGGLPTTQSLARFGLLSGTLENSVATATVGANSGDYIGLDSNGNLYCAAGGLHAGGAVQIDGEALTLSNSITYPVNKFGGGGWANYPAGTDEYMLDVGVGGGIIGTLSQVNLLKNFSLNINQNFPQIRFAYPVGGKTGSQKGYIFYYPSISSDPQTVTIQTATAGLTPSITTTGTLVPTDIDAGWTEIYLDGVTVDQTDELLLGIFHGQSGASKIAKIDPSSGAVSWTLALPLSGGRNVSVGTPFALSRVISSRLCIITGNSSGSPPTTVTTIDTSAGTSTSYTTNLAGMTIFGYQSYWDDQGAILLQTQFNQTAGSPTLLGSTPSAFTGWALLYVADAIAPPPGSAGRKFLAELGPVKIIA